jgi:hypothetical protein
MTGDINIGTLHAVKCLYLTVRLDPTGRTRTLDHPLEARPERLRRHIRRTNWLHQLTK